MFGKRSILPLFILVALVLSACGATNTSGGSTKSTTLAAIALAGMLALAATPETSSGLVLAATFGVLSLLVAYIVTNLGAMRFLITKVHRKFTGENVAGPSDASPRSIPARSR